MRQSSIPATPYRWLALLQNNWVGLSFSSFLVMWIVIITTFSSNELANPTQPEYSPRFTQTAETLPLPSLSFPETEHQLPDRQS